MFSAVLILTACATGRSPSSGVAADSERLAGAWRAKIDFQSGPLAAMKDLEFLYAYNAGGTMTESSNYDEAANSSPPAYGVWRATGGRTFETKYVFYTTEEPGAERSSAKGRDWWPAGYGVLTETLTLSDDGQTYTSTIRLVTFDKSGKAVPDGGGEGKGAGRRIAF
jgi:hypothetical protein